jgi:hypothetical protein
MSILSANLSPPTRCTQKPIKSYPWWVKEGITSATIQLNRYVGNLETNYE